MKKPFVLSMICHALIIFGALGLPKGCGGGGDGDGTNPPATNVVKFEPKPDQEPQEVSIIHEKGPGDRVKKSVKKKCTSLTYGGIGVTFSLMLSGRENALIVDGVAPGYVAESIGIKIGDVISSTEEIKGKVGTPVTLTIRSNGTVRTMTVLRDEICYRNQEVRSERQTRP